MNIANHIRTPIARLVHGIRQLSLSKRMSWIETMARNNKLAIYTEDYGWMNFNSYQGELRENILNEYLAKMEIIVSTLDKAYGGNWDMHVHPVEHTYSYNQPYDARRGWKFGLTPMIHFPDVHIISEDENEHDIKDLFVMFKLCFDVDTYRNYSGAEFYIQELSGFRSTLSFAEWNSGYAHSHLSMENKSRANSILYPHAFCLGSGDLPAFLVQFNDGRFPFDEDSLGMFFSLIETMIKWESISGNPYRYIKKLSEASSRYEAVKVIDNRTLEDWNRSFFEILRFNLRNMPKFTFSYNSGCFNVNFEEEHINFIKDLIVEKEFNHQNLLVRTEGDSLIGYVKGSNPEEIKSLLQSSLLIKDEVPYFFMSGQKIELKIGLPKSDIDINVSDFHIRNEFLNKLKNEFNKHAYKQQVSAASSNALSGVQS